MLAENLSQNFHHVPLERLKEKSKKWNAEKWENHLQNLEVDLRETLISHKQYKALSEIRSFSDSFKSYDNKPHRYSKNIKRARRALTLKEDKIIDLHYYRDLKIKRISKIMKLSSSATFTYRKRALGKIKKSLLSQSDFFLRIPK